MSFSRFTAFLSVLIFVIVAAIPAHSQFICGDADSSGAVNVADLTYLVNFLFQGGASPKPLLAGDCDGNGSVEVSDVTCLVEYLFRNGLEPCDTPFGSLTWYSDCKDYSWARDSVPLDQDCIEYSYDGASTLRLTHVNAGFNCCPAEILVDISIEGNVITITENETFDAGGPCACLCLFDVEMRIYHLRHGQYTIRVNELYVPEGDEPLEFIIDLPSAPDTGSYCVDRTDYPWGYW